MSIKTDWPEIVIGQRNKFGLKKFYEQSVFASEPDTVEYIRSDLTLSEDEMRQVLEVIQSWERAIKAKCCFLNSPYKTDTEYIECEAIIKLLKEKLK